MNRTQYLVNLAAQALGRTSNLLVNLLVLGFAARVLPPEEFGRYVFAVAFVIVWVQVADFGTTSSFSRGVAQFGTGLGAYWGNFLLVRAALGVVSLLLAAASCWAFDVTVRGPLLLATLAVPVVAARFFEPLYQVIERPWYSTWALLVHSTALLGLSAVAAFAAPRATTLVLAYLFAHGAYLAAALLLSSRVVRPVFAPERRLVHELWRIAWPVGAASLFTAVNSRAGLFFLEHLRSIEDVASYGAALRLFELGVNVAVMLAGPLLPIFSRLAGEDRPALHSSYVRLAQALAWCSLPAAVAAPVLAPIAVRIVYGARYADAAPVLAVLAGLGVLVVFALVNASACLSLGVTRFAFLNTAAAVLVNVALSVRLVPGHGPVGSAWAAVGSELLQCGVSFFFVWRYLGAPFRAGALLRLFVANAGLAACLYLVPIGRPAALVLGLVAYLVVSARLGLVPVDLRAALPALWARVRARFEPSAQATRS